MHDRERAHYINGQRVYDAQHLARGVSVSETCFLVGFTSISSFSGKFARETGRSPQSFPRALFTFRYVAIIIA